MWKTVKLGDICFIQSGNSIAAKKKTKLFTNVIGTPYVATKDVGFDGNINYKNGIYIPQEYVNSFKISKSGSTLVCAEGGSAGRKIAFSMDDCCFVNKLFSITPNKSLQAKYIYYYALSEEFQSQFKAALHGLIGGVSLRKIKEFTITIPPLAEQQRIVAKLDASFAEIDEVVEKALAKEKEIEKFKNSFLTSMLNNNNWEEIKLNQICTKITDGSHNPPKGVPLSDFLMLSSKNIFNDAINFEKPRFLKEEDFIKENKRTDIQEGDILLTIVGTIGRCAVVNDYPKLFTLQRSVAVLKPIHDLVLSRFLMYTLQNMLQILHQGARGVAQKGVYLKSLKELTLRVPPLSEQHNIISKLDAMNEQIDSFRNYILSNKENYKALKSAILKSEIHQNKAA